MKRIASILTLMTVLAMTRLLLGQEPSYARKRESLSREEIISLSRKAATSDLYKNVMEAQSWQIERLTDSLRLVRSDLSEALVSANRLKEKVETRNNIIICWVVIFLVAILAWKVFAKKNINYFVF